MCKSHKMNGWGNKDCCETSNGRKLVVAKEVLKRYMEKGDEDSESAT